MRTNGNARSEGDSRSQMLRSVFSSHAVKCTGPWLVDQSVLDGFGVPAAPPRSTYNNILFTSGDCVAVHCRWHHRHIPPLLRRKCNQRSPGVMGLNRPCRPANANAKPPEKTTDSTANTSEPPATIVPVLEPAADGGAPTNEGHVHPSVEGIQNRFQRNEACTGRRSRNQIQH